MKYETETESFPRVKIGELIPTSQSRISRRYFGYYSQQDIIGIQRVVKQKKRLNSLAGVVGFFQECLEVGGRVLYLETRCEGAKIIIQLRASDMVTAIK